MKKIISAILIVVVVFGVVLVGSPSSAATINSVAETQAASLYDIVKMNGKKVFNVSQNDYSYYWGNTIKSYLVQNSDSTLTRVQYINESKKTVLIENYSSDGRKLLSSKNIKFELSIFGGFFSGKNYNFLVFGAENIKESDNVEVVRIVKYTKSWSRLGATSVYGANTSIPFHAGSLRMAESGDTLYIRTCHKMYRSSDGLNHQANMSFVVRQSDGKLLDSDYLVSNFGTGYVSHSFNQFIQAEGSYVYGIDHGDAYPRAICITKFEADDSNSRVAGTNVIDLSKTGKTGDNWTGATIGGFELSDNGCIIAGSIVNYDKYDVSPDDTQNIFISVTDKNLKKTSVNMLTKYNSKSGIEVSNPHLVKISNSKYLILWEEYVDKSEQYYTKMAVVDANGNLKTSIYGSNYLLSDCKPILCSDGFVRWYVGDSASLKMYSLNPDNLSKSKNTSPQPEIEEIKVKLVTGEKYHISALDIEDSGYSSSGYELISPDDNNDICENTAGWSIIYVYVNNRVIKYDIEVVLSTPKISKLSAEKNGVKISWGKVKGAYLYRVFVKNGSKWKTVGTTSKTSLTHKNLTSGKSYTYTVRCVDDWGEYISAYDKSGTTIKYLKTPKVSKRETVKTGIKLTWSSVSKAEKYRVFVKNGSSWKKLTDTKATSFIHTSVKPGKTYKYTVRCVSSNGKTYQSYYVSDGVKHKCVETPALRSVKKKSGGVRFVWKKVNSAEKYRVFRKTKGGSWKKVADVSPEKDYFLDKNVKKGVTYTYTVRCVSSSGKLFQSYYNKTGLTIKR